MLPVIVSFDPDLPIVTSREVSVGGRTFGADAPFPWKELGLDERQLRDFYRSGYVRCLPASADEPDTTSTAAPSSTSRDKRKR